MFYLDSKGSNHCSCGTKAKISFSIVCWDMKELRRITCIKFLQSDKLDTDDLIVAAKELILKIHRISIGNQKLLLWPYFEQEQKVSLDQLALELQNGLENGLSLRSKNFDVFIRINYLKHLNISVCVKDESIQEAQGLGEDWYTNYDLSYFKNLVNSRDLNLYIVGKRCVGEQGSLYLWIKANRLYGIKLVQLRQGGKMARHNISNLNSFLIQASSKFEKVGSLDIDDAEEFERNCDAELKATVPKEKLKCILKNEGVSPNSWFK